MPDKPQPDGTATQVGCSRRTAGSLKSRNCLANQQQLPQADQHRQRLLELPRQPLVQRIDAVEPERVHALPRGLQGNLAALAPASGNDSDIARAVRDE